MIKLKESLINITKKNLITNDKAIKVGKNIIDDLKLEAIRELKTNKILSIIESTADIDGTLFSFCEENGYTIKNIDFFSVVSLSSQDVNYYDPYMVCGCFLIEKDDFKFIKYANFNNSVDFDKVISMVIVPEEKYSDYLKFKTGFQYWVKKNKGVVVSVIGGDDYIVDCNKDVDDLFFGEHESLKSDVLKSDVFGFIGDFLNNESFYVENNLPWKSSIFIEGEPGSGKTELINTIISNFDVSPITINKYNCDDSILEAIFNIVTTTRKSIIIVEDIDELIEQNLVSLDSLLGFLDKNIYGSGSILLITSKTSVELINEISFRFDKFIELQLPEYKGSIDKLFGDFVSEKALSNFKDSLKDNEINYNYINKIKELFYKTNMNTIKDFSKKTKLKNSKDLLSILDIIINETNVFSTQPKPNTKIGLIKGK